MAAKRQGEDDLGLDSIASGGLLEAVRSGAQKIRDSADGVDTAFEQKFQGYRKMMQKDAGQRTKEQTFEGLDGVLQQGEEFKKLVTEMNVNLDKYFTSFQDQLGKIHESDFGEKFLNFKRKLGLIKKVDYEAKLNQRTYHRLMNQEIDVAGVQMLTHGTNTAKIVRARQEKMIQAYTILNADKKKMTLQFEEADKQCTAWTKQFDESTAKLDELTQRLTVASTKDRAAIQKDMAEFQIIKDNADSKKSVYTVVMQRCTEDMAEIEKHITAYNQIAKDLLNIRANIEQQVMHYANALPLIKKALEAAVAVKGADMFGDQIRAVLKGAGEVVTGAALEIAKIGRKTLDAKIMTPEDFDRQSAKLIQAAQIYTDGVMIAKGYVESGGKQKTTKAAVDGGMGAGAPVGGAGSSGDDLGIKY